MMKFKSIPGAGRTIIVICALGVFVIAGVACWTSYNAIYRLVSDMGLYGEKTNRIFPLLLDAAFLVAELAAVLGVIMHRVTRSEEVSPAWPVVTMILCGVCTIVFNVAHAYLISKGGWADPMARVRGAVSALPPVLMILSFQVLIAIVKWVMLRLGRPEQVFAASGVQDFTGYGAGTFPPQGPYGEMPSVSAQRAGQNGHDRNKGELTREYLDTLDRNELAVMTRAQLAADMHTLGVPIDETYAGSILGKYRANGGTKVRRR